MTPRDVTRSLSYHACGWVNEWAALYTIRKLTVTDT